ncbi:hypothetical protein [Citrobacter amalonaticus]|uniref:hypothetical protein n=1 Tax=Citrobacter amalonaticus TaxID=35703 RepID=UPI000F661120|nr:hypothetical protein EGW07_24455 [Citrobacter amalonaticus]
MYDLWEAWLKLTAIEGIRHGVSPAEYKRDYIQFHAVMINAFGFAIQELLRRRPAHIIVQMIEELVTKATMTELEDFFLISSWEVFALIPARREQLLLPAFLHKKQLHRD